MNPATAKLLSIYVAHDGQLWAIFEQDHAPTQPFNLSGTAQSLPIGDRPRVTANRRRRIESQAFACRFYRH
jgi:hypothetical protein